MKDMTDRQLISRAEALGVSASYLNWRRERVAVPAETLRAIIDALGDPPGHDHHPAADHTTADDSTADHSTADQHAPDRRAPDRRAPDRRAPDRRAADPRAADCPPALKPRLPRERRWGFTVQLYSIRSRRSWGHGDLRDLADLARWSASQLGADFILINPLHAAEPAPPVTDSPYLPMTRRYLSPLYLRVEDVAEYQQLTGAQRQYIEELAGRLRAASSTPDLIDRDLVWLAKRRALEAIWQVPRRPARERSYRRFAEREGASLAAWASWCALAERHGPDWRTWPGELADPARAARATATGSLAERAMFHAWLQWLLDGQLAEAQRAARAAGMSIGVIGDLAVGAHPGGADAWAQKDLLVRGMSVGAPPDGFNQRGQDWAQSPWHPQRLAAAGARPLADLLGAALRHAGGLRVDHVMALMRLWWVPAGMPPERGAYVRYDHRLTVGALAAEAARAGALAIGEDLGTVDPWIRRYLAGQHVLGTEMAWFARERDGSPLRLPHWRRACMATLGTHDVPPVAGFVSGDHVTVRARLGLLKDPEAERKTSELRLSAWQDVLMAERLIPAHARGDRLGAEEFTLAMYRFLELTPARLIGVSLPDAVGDRRTQNIPGTFDEYPNWRVPLCDGEGRAVLLEDLGERDFLRSVVGAATGQP